MVEVCALIRQLEAGMAELGYPRKDSFAVNLILRESLSNAIRHGHNGDQTRAVLINYHLSPEAVLVEVADEGNGFNPYAVPNPFEKDRRGRSPGRGILLMRLYMSWIRFNRRGNRVLLCKRRSAT
jgi:serine/threonine-protein kinase RsbW